VKADGGTHLISDGGQLGLYGLLKSKGFYAQVLGEAGLSTYDTQRTTFGGTATGKTDGNLMSGVLGMGYRITTGRWILGPLASLQYTQVHVNGFQETGSLAPEAIEKQDDHSAASRLGGRVAADFDLGRNWIMTPAIKGAWLKEFDNRGGSITASIADQTFTVMGSHIGRSGCEAEIGVGLQWKNSLNVSARYQKVMGRDNFNANTVGGQVRINL